MYCMSDVSWCTCTLFKRQALFVYVARVAISLQWCRRNDMQRLLFCTGHRLFHVSFRSYQACWTMAGKSGAFGTHSFHDSFRNHRDFFSLSLSRFTLSHVFKSVSVFTSRQPHRMGGCCCFHLPMVQKWKGSSLSPPRLDNLLEHCRCEHLHSSGHFLSETCSWSSSKSLRCPGHNEEKCTGPRGGLGGPDSNYCNKCLSGTDKQAIRQNV